MPNAHGSVFVGGAAIPKGWLDNGAAFDHAGPYSLVLRDHAVVLRRRARHLASQTPRMTSTMLPAMDGPRTVPRAIERGGGATATIAGAAMSVSRQVPSVADAPPAHALGTQSPPASLALGAHDRQALTPAAQHVAQPGSQGVQAPAAFWNWPRAHQVPLSDAIDAAGKSERSEHWRAHPTVLEWH